MFPVRSIAVVMLFAALASSQEVDWHNGDPVAQTRPAPVQQPPAQQAACDIEQNGQTVTVTFPISSQTFIHGGTPHGRTFGKRQFQVSSSRSAIFIAVTDVESLKTGPSVFVGRYRDLEGDSASGGFTGRISLLSSDEDPERALSFHCYKL